MKVRQFERARQPITVSIGKKKYTALDWSPNGFQLPKGLAHGYEGKWYPVTLTINDPRSPVKMTGKAQPRWSTATHSGFYFKSDQDAANIPTSGPTREQATKTSPLLNAANNPLAATPDADYDTATHVSSNTPEPPTLTQAVRTGRVRSIPKPGTSTQATTNRINQLRSSQAVPNETSQPSGPRRQTTLSPRNFSRIGFVPARIIAPGQGSVVEVHRTPGHRVFEGDALLTVSTGTTSDRKQALLEEQDKERKELENIQQAILSWEARARNIDSDDGIDIGASREQLSNALQQLNSAHELQKRCRGPMQHYTQANIQYRSSWKQHREAIAKAEDEAVQRSQKRLKQIRFKLNQLQKRHRQTLKNLETLSQQLKNESADGQTITTIRAPFKGRVRELYTNEGRRFNAREVLMEMENHNAPVAEILVSPSRIKNTREGALMNVQVGSIKVELEGSVSEIIPSPSNEQLLALGYKLPTGKKPRPALMRIKLDPASAKLENIEQLRNQKLEINWPAEPKAASDGDKTKTEQ